MNLPRVVYNFAVALEAQSPAEAALKNSTVHFHRKQEMNKGGGAKFVRVGGLLSSKPMPNGDNTRLTEFDALIDVYFVQIPENQTAEKQFEAQETADQMANEFILAINEDRHLGTNDCEIVQATTWEKASDFIAPGNIKMPVSALRLTINSQR